MDPDMGICFAGRERVDMRACNGLSKAFDVLRRQYPLPDGCSAGVLLGSIVKNWLPVKDFTVALPMWPLGQHPYTNKSARMTPARFASALREADEAAPDYIWIYGFGSAWQTNGPYGRGVVVNDF